MKNRWVNLLFALLIILFGGLSFHLFVLAQTKEAIGLIINILKPLNILLFSILLFVLSRYLLKLYLGYKSKATGFRLQTKLVLALLPLTLLPSFALFFLSTSFVDDFLLRTVKSPEQTELLTATNDFTEQHFREVEALHLAHTPNLLPLLRAGEIEAITTYLDKANLDAVEYLIDGERKLWVASTGFHDHDGRQLDRSSPLRNAPQYRQYKDGQLVARFAYREGNERLNYIYTMNSGFTEHYMFLRDSYVYLKYSQKKAHKLVGLNRSILLVTTLFIIFGGVWIAMSFARGFISAFTVLINGAEDISRGKLDTRIALKTGDEIEDVIQAFNSMAERLGDNREELEQRARDLGLLNARLQSEIQYNEAILRDTRVGILSTDGNGRVRTFNPALNKILDLELKGGEEMEELLNERRFETVQQMWHIYKVEGFQTRQMEVSNREGTSVHIAATLVPLQSEMGNTGSLLLIEDLTELLSAQKLAAWRDVAKRVAHEIKNPLTPIQLSIQRVERKARKGANDLVEAVYSAHETIISETTLLKSLVDEFSTFAKMPSPVKKNTDLGELVCSVHEAYRPVHQKLRLEIKVPDEPIIYPLDGGQFRQVLGNLLNNAAQASEPGGLLMVTLESSERGTCLFVDDEGKGIDSADLQKVFLPYYSKSPKGNGLGLAIVRRIIEDHGGTIEASLRQPKGTRFTIHLPPVRSGR